MYFVFFVPIIPRVYHEFSAVLLLPQKKTKFEFPTFHASEFSTRMWEQKKNREMSVFM